MVTFRRTPETSNSASTKTNWVPEVGAAIRSGAAFRIKPVTASVKRRAGFERKPTAAGNSAH